MPATNATTPASAHSTRAGSTRRTPMSTPSLNPTRPPPATPTQPPVDRLLREGDAGGAEVVAGLYDTSCHAGFCGLAVGARVVLLLVADLAVDLEHAVVVLEQVVDDRAGEGVLGVGVDVH